jgi:colanic acid/amylovoran biosynthesis glycosyltransferase
MATIALFRRAMLPRSETFIRNEALALERYSAIFLGMQREAGLDLPEDRVFIAPAARSRFGAARARLLGRTSTAVLADACRAHSARIVHAHFGHDALPALDVARRLGLPLVVTFHGFDATTSDEALAAQGGALAEYVRRRDEIFAEAALLIGVSGFITDELRGRGAPEHKLRVHHQGIALGPPRDSEPGAPCVLFVGRHVAKKGLGDLLEAMATVRRAVPDARLLLVGDGPDRRIHEARARELGVEAEFLGWRTPEEVGRFMAAARVLCVPSRRAENGDAEGLPTVILEALACGLPVVGTRHSGIPEAIGPGRGGLLADERDVQGLARHLTAVLGDDDLWRRLSAAGRDNARHNFDPRRQTAELEGFYDEVLAAGDGDRRG